MSTSEVLSSHDRTPVPPATHRPHSSPTGLALVVLVLALAVVTITAVALWSHGTQPTTPAAPDPAPFGSPAYLPGGSVYEQQVPDYIDWSIGYGPGSYLYNAQVPAEAR